MEALWSAALPLLRQQLGERNFSAWIEPIHCRGSAGEIRLEVPSPFFQQWVMRHFLPGIRDTLAQLSGKSPQVRLVVRATGMPRRASRRRPSRARRRFPARRASPRIGRIVPHYTFETFIVGAANEVAFKAARAIAEAPGRRFNPVFLHGGVGLGKTHLINAVAHHLLRPASRLRVACLSAETFMNSLIGSLRQDQMNAFRDRFRLVDALILDDVQFLAGKERTQEEFFHTFNALYGAEKQIVLTSDKRPAAISGLEQRLRSRFEGGLIADIHPPTRELRQAILRAKAGRLAVDLSDEVVEELVRRSGPSVRELEGALNRVLAIAAVRETAITPELVEAALGPLMRAATQRLDRSGAGGGRQSLQSERRRARLAPPHAPGVLSAPGRDVSEPHRGGGVADGDRREVRRPRPHHGHVRGEGDRVAPRQGRPGRPDPHRHRGPVARQHRGVKGA